MRLKVVVMIRRVSDIAIDNGPSDEIARPIRISLINGEEPGQVSEL